MNISTLIFGWIVATLVGALYHLWKDGGFWMLVVYIIASWIGFFLGHLAASKLGLDILAVGQLQMGGGIVGSILILFLAHWLGKVNQSSKSNS